jgi:SAM-dependent methyltransferase
MAEPEITEQMREDWDRRAREDAAYYVAFGGRRQSPEEFFSTAAPVLQTLRSEFRRFSSAPKTLSALEIGCGPGRLLVPLSRDFGRITGVDVSPEMIRRARRNIESIPNAAAEMVSGSDLSGMTDESFDFCYSYAVFQHIPSRSVVWNYLSEAQRVLKTGGLLKCQFNGLPETERRPADTWSGVRFSAGELRAYCQEHGLQLLSLDGANTQDLWICARKQPPGWTRSLAPQDGVHLVEVGNTYTSDRLVPVSGRFSAVSLWVKNLSPGADINNLEIEIGGRKTLPCYLSEDSGRAPVQINAFLPAGLPTGLVQVRLWMLGRPVSNFARLRLIPPPPRRPRLLGVTDAIELLSPFRIETGTIKAEVEEAGLSPEIAADIDGVPAQDIEIRCVNPLSEHYAVIIKTPSQIGPGQHSLNLRLHGRILPAVSIEVAR